MWILIDSAGYLVVYSDCSVESDVIRTVGTGDMCETFLPGNLVINSQVLHLTARLVSCLIRRTRLHDDQAEFQVNWNKIFHYFWSHQSSLDLAGTCGRTVTASSQLLLSSAASLMSWTCLKLIEILNNISENGR